ncbi:hypothetical protein [Streptomyces sp. NPDC089799]|uniref:hypothetical protein n=1 Tax=Streptomyces sp. NPDC089799 TaxID=3155066 RepID=UPI00341D777C
MTADSPGTAEAAVTAGARVGFYTYGHGPLWGVRVDGTDLRVRVAEATRALWLPDLEREAAVAAAEGEEPPGPEALEERVLRQHAGMPADDLGDPARHFLGEVSREVRQDLWEQGREDLAGMVPLLGCCCTVWQCWPLLARVTVTPRTVTWSLFRQPYRPEWGELAIGPYVFGRARYEDALAHPVALGRDGDPLGPRTY